MAVKLRMPQSRGKDAVYEAAMSRLPRDQKHLFYIEPYGGSGEVLLNKEPSSEEALNDLDPDLILVYKAIRDQTADFLNALEQPAVESPEGLQRAAWLVRDHKPKGGWARYVQRLAERLDSVYLFNRTAVEVLKAFDDEDVVAFVDPPPMPQTRNVERTSPLMMTAEDHLELADVLRAFRGRVVLTALPCPVYNRLFKAWTCHRVSPEYVWTNY